MKKMNQTHQPSLVIVDDDPYLLKSVGRNIDHYLRWPYQVFSHAQRAENFLQKQKKTTTHIIGVLDVQLPDQNGFKLAEQLARKSLCQGVIMLTQNGDMNSKLRGFEVGADDYIVKPFVMMELIARIKALAKRISPLTQSEQTESPTSFYLNKGEVKLCPGQLTFRQQMITLSHSQTVLLRTLFKRAPNIVSFAELEVVYHQGRNTSYQLSSNRGAMRTTMYRLRQKLAQYDLPFKIMTHPQYGYFVNFANQI